MAAWPSTCSRWLRSDAMHVPSSKAGASAAAAAGLLGWPVLVACCGSACCTMRRSTAPRMARGSGCTAYSADTAASAAEYLWGVASVQQGGEGQGGVRG